MTQAFHTFHDALISSDRKTNKLWNKAEMSHLFRNGLPFSVKCFIMFSLLHFASHEIISRCLRPVGGLCWNTYYSLMLGPFRPQPCHARGSFRLGMFFLDSCLCVCLRAEIWWWRFLCLFHLQILNSWTFCFVSKGACVHVHECVLVNTALWGPEHIFNWQSEDISLKWAHFGRFSLFPTTF